MRSFIIFVRIVKKTIKRACYLFIDAIDVLLGKRDELTPPKRKIFVGGYCFKEIGNEFLKYSIELGGIRKDGKVLDVGCGIGRMAVPLTGYLSKEGAYEGFDLVADGIKWCKKKITTK
jgi:2-polyprenyl-3-methyl-5-hydroxy-6-metoxy-1,4-benzoquinol methylase